MTNSAGKNTDVATIAGGCFWGVEELIRAQEGVVDTETGYAGGTSEKPTYREVCTGKTGHAEAVQITFDATQTTYQKILEFFFRMHDPTTLNRQHNDVGTQYRSAIFYNSPEQKQIAAEVVEAINKSGKWKSPVVTEIVPLVKFYPAESEHQDYLQRIPDGYNCHFVRD